VKIIIPLTALILLSSCFLPTENVDTDPISVAQTLPFRSSLEIETIIGQVQVVAGTGDSVHIAVVGAVGTDLFGTSFTDTGTSLRLRELIPDTRNTSGWWTRWTITLPAAAGLAITSGSGSITLEDVTAAAACASGSGEIMLDGVDGTFVCTSGSGRLTIASSSGTFTGANGSGRITVSNSSGTFSLESGSGGVSAHSTTGDFALTSGSGDVTAGGLMLLATGSFTSGSGDVAIGLPGGENYTLALSSGSGDAVLDLNGADPTGTFTLRCLLSSGRIVCPWDVDRSEIVTRSGQEYREKTYVRGTGGLTVGIGTGSGTARIIP